MTTLTAGSSKTLVLRDTGQCTVTTNGGFASVVETVAGESTAHTFGPRPMRMTFGPYAEGGTVVITNDSAVLDYDSPLGNLVTLSDDGTSLVSGDLNFYFAPSSSVICAAFGDSITAQNTLVNSTQSYLYGNGPMVWASILSGGKLFFSSSLNLGVAGNTTADMTVRLESAAAAAYALGARYCVIHAGTNDVYGSVTYAETIANLAAIYAKFLGYGMTPIVVPILPRAKDGTSGSMLTADRQKLQRINTWIRNYARDNPNIIIADPTLNIVDQAVTNGDPLGALLANSTAYTYDGLHPAARGAYWMGKAIADAMQYRLSGIQTSLWSQIDTHDVTHNPSGNLLTNGYMTGITGTYGTGGSGASGLATGWAARRLVGSTGSVVCSKSTVTAGNGTTYPQQTVTFSATAGVATEELQVYQQIFPSGTTYAVGDTVYAECEASVSGVTAASLRSVYLKCSDDGVDARCGQPSGAGYMPDSNWSGVLRTPAFVIKAGTTAITVSIHAQIDGTVALAGLTLNFGRVALRKVGV